MIFALNLQPDLSGNPFLRRLKFYLNRNRLQKRLGAEGGLSCHNYKTPKILDSFYFYLVS
ncbi:hypothetical protein D3C87_811930 [compost metagenome]